MLLHGKRRINQQRLRVYVTNVLFEVLKLTEPEGTHKGYTQHTQQVEGYASVRHHGNKRGANTDQ